MKKFIKKRYKQLRGHDHYYVRDNIFPFLIYKCATFSEAFTRFNRIIGECGVYIRANGFEYMPDILTPEDFKNLKLEGELIINYSEEEKQ